MMIENKITIMYWEIGMGKKILLIDDDPELGKLVDVILRPMV
jgi:hypothetical protein